MNAPTYRDLLTYLNSLPEPRLDDTITVYVREMDEFYPLSYDHPFTTSTEETCDVLDPGHLFLVV